MLDHRNMAASEENSVTAEVVCAAKAVFASFGTALHLVDDALTLALLELKLEMRFFRRVDGLRYSSSHLATTRARFYLILWTSVPPVPICARLARCGPNGMHS